LSLITKHLSNCSYISSIIPAIFSTKLL